MNLCTESSKKIWSRLRNCIDENGYQHTFYFFYSQSASNDKVEEYKTLARIKYGITLEIIDAKHIGSLLDKPKYLRSKNTLRAILGFSESTDSLDIGTYEKMGLELLSFGSQTMEIKRNLVRSYMLFTLHQNSVISREAICADVVSHFNEHIDQIYAQRQLNWFRTENKVAYYGPDNTLVRLSEEEKNRNR